MQTIDQITLSQLSELAKEPYHDLIKAVVDIELGIVIVDAPMHADLEQFLLSQGSKQSNLWGVNLHPSLGRTASAIEFDSMINLKPHQNNFSRNIVDPKIQAQIIELILSKIIA